MMHKSFKLLSKLSLVILACGAAVSLAQQQQQPAAGGGTSSSSLPLPGQSRQAGMPSTGSLTAVPDDFANLKLTPGFLLNIQVYGDPELSTQSRVDKEGNISMPFIGSVHVGDSTIAEAQTQIQDKLRSGEILTNPQVTVNVEQYAASNVTVLGEVQSPGRRQLLAPHSLLDVIGMAGGETNLAGNLVQIKHVNADGTTASQNYTYTRSSNGDTIRNVEVHPGDTVIVVRAGIVYVLGAVNRPGGYVMQEDGSLNVAQALSLALGTSLQAKISELRVVRHEGDGQLKEIPVSYNDIMKGKQRPMQLQAEDIVYVPVSKIKATFTSGASIVGQTASASIFAVK
jgi:polysaccharide export outer membrane protein